MNTSEFIKEIRRNFIFLPSKQEVKQFIYKNNIDINKSTDEITQMLLNSYRGANYRYPGEKKEYNTSSVSKSDIQKCMDMGMPVIRLEDKINRLKSLVKNQEAAVKDESLIDTLMDLANYSIMTIIELEGEKENE